MHRTYAVGSLLLILGTWLLWTPQQLFPRVPAFSSLASLPPGIDNVLTWSLLGVWLSVSAALVVFRSRWLAWCYALLFLALVALDQHRLQPWGIHLALGLLLLTNLERPVARRWVVFLTASIYIYSALSKFDTQFLHTVGQDFLNSLFKQLGINAANLAEPTRVALATAFPIGEWFCGLGLLWPRMRNASLLLAIVMHGLLLMILGPLGLNHSWGVLLWNAVFIAQNVWLLQTRSLEAPSKADSATVASSITGSKKFSLVQGICLAMFVMPAGERLGLVDHWLGWALYAPHSSRATIEVTDAAVARALDPLSRYFDSADQLGWRRLRVDQWSLSVLGVPMYPQQRLYLGAARAVAQDLEALEIRVLLQSASDRFTGRRKLNQLEGRLQIEQAASRYWFSTQPAHSVVPSATKDIAASAD